MRLLHTTEFRFEEFFDGNIPKYAILSHTWGPDEVSFQDFLTIPKDEEERAHIRTEQAAKVNRKATRVYRVQRRAAAPFRFPQTTTESWARQKKEGAGYRKIAACCKFASMDTVEYGDEYSHVQGPFDWVWIDTCCIDKSSSAELSEAINSMRHWYKRASICYAFLSDVHKDDEQDLDAANFGASRWFTRGWTLQEVLAPRFVQFVDQRWTRIGMRDDLLATLGQITGIQQRRWRGFMGMCVAEKFSWAARRKTSRLEDQAYCLLGLFEINIPLLYGERQKAFYRLQIEIIRASFDESIFVWDVDSNRQRFGNDERDYGVLAPDPSSFRHWRNSTGDNYPWKIRLNRIPYAITNHGLEFWIPRYLSNKSEILLPLRCLYYEDGKAVGVYAVFLSQKRNHGFWYRRFPADNNKLLREFGDEVRRVPGCTGLFVVPTAWVWSREHLEEVGSTFIYLQLQDEVLLW